MMFNILIVASLLSPLAFWLAAPRRVPAPVKACRRAPKRSL